MSGFPSLREQERLESLERECERQNEQHWRKFGTPHPSFGEDESE